MVSLRSATLAVAAILLVINYDIYSVSAVLRPAWLNGARINEWIPINGTAGSGGAAVNAFSGFAFNELNNELWIALAGGHSDSSDNRVVSISIANDNPVWVQRLASSTNATIDVAYYADGTPSSRHTYQNLHFVPQLNRLIAFGCRFSYGNAYTFPYVDSFNPETNRWDPPGTLANAPSGHYGAVREISTGVVWTNGLARWSPVTNQWTQPITSRTTAVIRWPIAHDSRRNQLFTLNWADGESYGDLKMHATRIPVNGSSQFNVRFNPSAAVDAFIADAPAYSGMDYDPSNDRFLFYYGQGTSAGRIYVITPNDGDDWDMSLLTLASGSALPPASPGSGVNNRFRYVPDLGGFIMLPAAAQPLWFISTGDPTTVPPVSITPVTPAPIKAPAAPAPIKTSAPSGSATQAPKAKSSASRSSSFSWLLFAILGLMNALFIANLL
jgi:hypothetical protein